MLKKNIVILSLLVITFATVSVILLHKNTDATYTNVASVSYEQLHLYFNSINYFRDISSAQKTIHAKIENNSTYFYLYDHVFRLYRYVENNWYPLIPVVTGVFPVTVPTIFILPNSITPLSFGIIQYGDLESGMYKIVMEIQKIETTTTFNNSNLSPITPASTFIKPHTVASLLLESSHYTNLKNHMHRTGIEVNTLETQYLYLVFHLP